VRVPVVALVLETVRYWIEMVTLPERRRRWSAEQKRALVCREPGAGGGGRGDRPRAEICPG